MEDPWIGLRGKVH